MFTLHSVLLWRHPCCASPCRNIQREMRPAAVNCVMAPNELMCGLFTVGFMIDLSVSDLFDYRPIKCQKSVRNGQYAHLPEPKAVSSGSFLFSSPKICLICNHIKQRGESRKLQIFDIFWLHLVVCETSIAISHSPPVFEFLVLSKKHFKTQLCSIYRQTKQVSFEELEPDGVWHFCVEIDTNDEFIVKILG